jgi:HPt (histidine-containing phosphotransfer) domain-containing protein
MSARDFPARDNFPVRDQDCTNGIIDAHHLGRMTLGDRGLEREILQIFLRQMSLMLGRIRGAEPALAAAAAHTLKGSARGIGAWHVAQAAERIERASRGGSDCELDTAIGQLRQAAAEANAAIEARLCANSVRVASE